MNRLSKSFIRNTSQLSRLNHEVTCSRPDYGLIEVQRSQLNNGTRMAVCRPRDTLFAACTVMYEAGSRYEIDDQLGVTHFIRNACDTTGLGYTGFSKMKLMKQHGSFLSCSSDRQNVSFTLICPPDRFSSLKYYLLDTVNRCEYPQWEIEDRLPQIKEDLVRVHPQQRVLDLVQKAAWVGPLSNSVFCIEERMDAMTSDYINCFIKTNFRSDKCSVASYGVPFEDVSKFAESLDLCRSKPSPRQEMVSSPRCGFEYYDTGKGSETWVAVALPGTGTCDFRCLLKYGIIAAACGEGRMESGQHRLDRILQPPLGHMSGEDPFTDYAAFNISYRETGLFGIIGRSRACSARDMCSAAAEFLANVHELDFDQIEVGKRRLKLNMCINDEDHRNVTESLALQLANGVQIDNPKCTMAIIDTICPDEVKTAACTLTKNKSKMAVAVVGDIGAVPHDREIFDGLC